MILAVCRAHALALRADRGALAMTFVLPVLVYLVFAAIFSGATGADLRVTVALVDELASSTSRRLTDALVREPSLRPRLVAARADAEALVVRGEVDAVIVVRKDARGLDQIVGDQPAPVLVMGHPARAVARDIVAGVVQRVYFAALPDAALGGVVAMVDELVVPLTDAQRQEAARAVAEMGAATTNEPGEAPFGQVVETAVIQGAAAATGVAAYYAAAVAALFVLLAAVPVAAGIHDDLASGIADRAVAGPAGVGALVDGRTLFLVGVGVLQVSVVFACAWVRAGVPPPSSPAAWVAMALAVAIASAGLVVLAAVLCTTSRQAVTASNIVVLVASAIGGSMVPRFLMPTWMQSLGWMTPNAWAIEGFARASTPGDSLVLVSPAVSVLTLAGIAAWMSARTLVRRRAAH